MTTWTLAHTSTMKVLGKTETAYTYKAGDQVVRFCAHPTAAWEWCLCTAVSTVGWNIANDVIEAFVVIALAGHDFNEPIKSLEVA
jgi:hypothetical protein